MSEYCKLFLNTTMDHEELMLCVAAGCNAKRAGNTILTRWGEMYLDENDAVNTPAELRDDASFLYYPYYLDIEPSEQTSHQAYVTGLSDLLRWLWEQGVGVVAACDFEEELPLCGGYNMNRRESNRDASD